MDWGEDGWWLRGVEMSLAKEGFGDQRADAHKMEIIGFTIRPVNWN